MIRLKKLEVDAYISNEQGIYGMDQFWCQRNKRRLRCEDFQNEVQNIFVQGTIMIWEIIMILTLNNGVRGR